MLGISEVLTTGDPDTKLLAVKSCICVIVELGTLGAPVAMLCTTNVSFSPIFVVAMLGAWVTILFAEKSCFCVIAALATFGAAVATLLAVIDIVSNRLGVDIAGLDVTMLVAAKL